MFKLKSVVFIVFIIATCSVFGKIKKLNKGLSTQIAQGQVQVQGGAQVGIKDEGKKEEPKKEEPKKDEPKKEEPKKEEPKKEEPKREEPKPEPKPELAEEVKEKVGEDLFLGADIGDDETPFDFEFRHFYELLLSSYGEYPEEYYYYYEDEENPVDPYRQFNDFVDFELWAIDRDGDGAVSYDEYLERLAQLAERYRIPEEYFTEKDVKDVFDHFNHNEDDVLDREEFAELVQAVLGLLVGHFEHVNGTPLEKLFNLREYLQMVHYFLGPEGEVDEIPDLSHDEEERYDPLDWVFNVTKFFKYADSETPVPEEEQVVTVEDGRNIVDWFVLGYIQANERLREAVLGELKGDKPVDAREFKEAIKRALRKLAKALERKKDELEKELHDLEEEELQAEVEGSAQAFLKLKSAKKSRKMKKNLKNKTDLSKKTRKIKKSKKSKKIAMKK